MIFVHLFNDRSGSPTVLSSVIDVVGDPDNDLLFVAEGNGILSSAPIEKRYYRYRRRNSRLLTFLSTCSASGIYFFRCGRKRATAPEPRRFTLTPLIRLPQRCLVGFLVDVLFIIYMRSQ